MNIIIFEGVLSFLFGTIDNFLIAFIAVLLVEYITSTVNLIINKSVNLKKLFYPFIKYFYYFILIIL